MVPNIGLGGFVPGVLCVPFCKRVEKKIRRAPAKTSPRLKTATHTATSAQALPWTRPQSAAFALVEECAASCSSSTSAPPRPPTSARQKNTSVALLPASFLCPCGLRLCHAQKALCACPARARVSARWSRGNVAIDTTTPTLIFAPRSRTLTSQLGPVFHRECHRHPACTQWILPLSAPCLL